MKELKFRAWSEETKSFEYFDLNNGTECGLTNLQIWARNTQIEQYTGLKDKNGKEIYEGDIVKITGVKQYFTFVWDDDELGYALEDENKRRYVVWGNKYQIIGNIHENHEMLEEDK